MAALWVTGRILLQLFGEGLDIRASDCRAKQACEFFRIVDRFDHLAKPFGNRLKPDFKRLDNVLLLRGNQALLSAFSSAFLAAFLTTFLSELLCKGADFFAAFFSELFGE